MHINGCVELKCAESEVYVQEMGFESVPRRDRPVVLTEEEHAVLGRIQPLSDVVDIGRRGRQGNDAWWGGLGQKAHSSEHGFQHGASLVSEQMDLINQDETNFRNSFCMFLPVASDGVPFLGRSQQ